MRQPLVALGCYGRRPGNSKWPLNSFGRVLRTHWPWIAAIWCAGALFDASQAVLIMHAEGRHHAWLPVLATELVSWLPWALATPFIVGLARRYPISQGMDMRAVAVHLAAF